MSRPEQLLWQHVGPLVRPYGHFERVENAFGSGMPDVTFCVQSAEGWLELKSRDRWPGGALGAPVTLPHYTAEQRRWARRRALAGGRVRWLLRVAAPVHEYVLLGGVAAAHLYEHGAPSYEDLLAAALWHHRGTFTARDAGGLIGGLTDIPLDRLGGL